MATLICAGLGVAVMMLAGAISPAGGILGGLAGAMLCMPRNQGMHVAIGLVGGLGLVSCAPAALIGCFAVMFTVKAVAGDEKAEG
jgi:hypothetical protein